MLNMCESQFELSHFILILVFEPQLHSILGYEIRNPSIVHFLIQSHSVTPLSSQYFPPHLRFEQ